MAEGSADFSERAADMHETTQPSDVTRSCLRRCMLLPAGLMFCASHPWSINGTLAIQAIRHILEFDADEHFPWCPP